MATGIGLVAGQQSRQEQIAPEWPSRARAPKGRVACACEGMVQYDGAVTTATELR